MDPTRAACFWQTNLVVRPIKSAKRHGMLVAYSVSLLDDESGPSVLDGTAYSSINTRRR